MSVIQVLETLEKTSSRNDKKDILAANKDPLFYEVLLASMDPYRTYGFQGEIDASCHVSDEEVDDEEEAENWQMLLCLLQDLAGRVYTGNAAKNAVAELLGEMSPTQQKWAKRVILKNLRCGVEAKTVNAVVPKLIPQFAVSLAETLRIQANGLADVTFPVWVDYKLDGIRTICVKEGNSIGFFSRKGHVIPTLPTLKAIIEESRAMELPDFVLDGETKGAAWNDTQSVLSSTKNKLDDSGMFYNVFDLVPLSDWRAGVCDIDYMSRRARAKQALEQIGHTRVRLIGGKEILNPYALNTFYKEALEAGHEGVMVKDPHAGYQFKRSRAIQKYKPHDTWEGQIVGFELGDPNGDRAGKFGAFMVQFQEGGAITNVGGGFDDPALDAINAALEVNPEYYDGQVIEVKGKELTAEGKVREPVFVRFRADGDT